MPYFRTDDGGTIGGTMRPFANYIGVSTHRSTFIVLSQDNDELCISEAQLLDVMDAIRRAAKHLGWQSFAEGER